MRMRRRLGVATGVAALVLCSMYQAAAKLTPESCTPDRVNASVDPRIAHAFRQALPPLTAEQIAGLPKWSTETMETRDRVTLAANVFLPKGEGPFPVVLSRTSYTKDVLGELSGVTAKKYVDAGYAFVLQDVRGKGASCGEYEPFSHDIEDGYDTVEWAAKQPWSNGKVGITGSSALGITANMAAVAAPPHLVAAFVSLTPHDQKLASYPGGVLRERDVLGWLTGQGAGPAMLAGVMTNSADPAYWDRRSVRGYESRIRIPIYNVGGWYDVFNDGNVDNFTRLQEFGGEGARGRQKLYMGAAGHGGLGGPASDIDYSQPGASIPETEEMRWWDYWLKGRDNGIMSEAPVKLFMMASGRRGHPSKYSQVFTATSWPPASEATHFYLEQDGGLSRTAPDASHSLSYLFDPKNPVPTIGGANQLQIAGPLDQRPIGQRPDYLRFETPVLTENVAIAGEVKAVLWASTDGTDTDFMVKLVDVHPDGYEQIILENPIRARFRAGMNPSQERKMIPGTQEKLILDLWNTAYTFEAGHKIQVVVTSSNSPKFQVNPNTGDGFGMLANPEFRVATNNIFVGGHNSSEIILPVIK